VHTEVVKRVVSCTRRSQASSAPSAIAAAVPDDEPGTEGARDPS
jgi:hypothetical protein